VSATRIEVKDLVIRYGEAVAVNGVSFTVDRGEHVTLLGPSGCGKTTTLRAIAGLEQPVSGSIRIDGHAMYDAAERKNIPTEQRGVSMVFQSYAVWPHMTVFDNVAYGLRVRKQGAAEIKANAERALDLVQMRHLAERPASKLSGGQQQRVALARALVFGPDLLLLDEPLSALDKKLRADLQGELRQLHRQLGTTFVYVTHDQEEALSMSDEIVIFNRGAVVQRGGPRELYDRPASHFVADFLGRTNFIEADIDRVEAADLFYRVGDLTLRQALTGPHAAGGKVLIGLRPEKMCLSSEPPAMGNALPAIVTSTTYLGSDQQVLLDSAVGAITVRVPGWPAVVPTPADKVWVSWAPDASTVLADDRS